MTPTCTCGARLPEGARFCHKCGKPQYDDPEPILETPVLAPPAASAPAPAPLLDISFHNRTAVRICFIAALVTFLLISLPVPRVLAVLWLLFCLVASGFFSVYLYSRRTGQSLTVRSGARMGWITGVFWFTFATVLFTFAMVSVASSGDLSDFFRSQFHGPPADIEPVLQALQTPVGLGAVMLIWLFLLFVFSTLLPAVGGALGAKVLEKE